MRTLIVNQYLSKLWTPAKITTALWLDAADSSTITTVSGAVSEWSDKSGNNVNATQSASGARPAYNATGFNGFPCLSLNGTNQFLSANALASSFSGEDIPWSAFVVCNGTSNFAFQFTIGFSQTGNDENFHALGFNNFNQLFCPRRQSVNQLYTLIGSVSTGSNLLISYLFTETLGTVWKNGELSATGEQDTPSMTFTAFSIGALNRVGITNFFSGNIAEVIITAGAIDTISRQKVEGYLVHKWGLTANLPVTHPYKTTPPYA